MAQEEALLVPMQTWALVVNGRQQTMRRWGMNYNNLRHYQSSLPAPFHTDIDDIFASTPKNEGIYLMWNLPAALRHGSQSANGSGIVFPPVPNRWLVVRFHGPVTGRQATAWIVESDQKNTSTGDGSAHATGSTYLDSSTSTPQQMIIGRNRPLVGWSEPGISPVTLQAVAPENVMFSAFQSTNNNVFSFHDNLVTQNILVDTLSYLVVGWYANGTNDPLAQGKVFLSQLQAFHWSVSDTSRTTTRSLYHGMVNAISWKQGTDAIPSPRDTASTNVNVAVGYSGIDALTARVASQLSSQQSKLNALLLEAFQYGMLDVLDQPGGQGLLEDKLREKWYGFTNGGTEWEIVDNTPVDNTTIADPPTADEVQAENQWLSVLNQQQATLDQSQVTLNGLQQQLYELWWKRGYANWYYSTLLRWPDGTTKQQFDAAFDTTNANSLISRTNAQLNLVKQQLENVPHETSAVTLEQATTQFAQDHHLPSSRRLKANALPRYWHANDPVALISGVNHATVDDFQGTLPCRWSDQIVTGIIYHNAALALDRIRPLVPEPDGWTNLPFAADSITRLLTEFFILDPTNASSIANAVLHTSDTQTISDLQKHMGSASVPAAASMILPFFGTEGWQQPWIPLFLEWQVTWYPIPFQQADMNLWHFDGLEYQFNQSIPQPAPQTLTGRSLLTPQVQNAFKKQLESFLQQHPDETLYQQLDTFISQMDNWDFLSQSMEGFTTQVALRNPFSMLAPDSTQILFADTQRSLSDVIGAGHFYVPLSLGERSTDPVNAGKSTFEGLRSGQFVFERLSIVDRFGQLIEVITSSTAQSFERLIIADGMKPTNPVLPVQSSRVVQLPPRLVQEGQLKFYLVAANGNPPQPLQPGSNVNPLVGWVLPNHLDQALSVYAPDGAYLGEMYVAVDGSGMRNIQWEAAPQSINTLDQITRSNPELGNVLSHLQRQDASNFFNFLSAVDETMWTIDPTQGHVDQTLAVLVGRPLALVRACLQFGIAGAPLYDPRWPDTFNANPTSPLFLYNQYNFSVRLGSQLDRSDGLIGYFLNENYDTLNVVHLPEGAQGTYLSPIQSGNFIPLTFASNSIATVTMFIDPRASVHAYTGLFPAVSLDVPATITQNALKNMKVAFHIDSLLSYYQTAVDTKTKVTTTSMQIPVPAEQGGAWSWLQLHGTDWVESGLAPEDQIARLRDDLPAIRDGLLTLKDALGNSNTSNG